MVNLSINYRHRESKGKLNSFIDGWQSLFALKLTKFIQPFLQSKRSLCNTFGGCGAKRSTQQLQRLDYFNPGMDNPSIEAKELPLKSSRESNPELVAEVLSDLFDYLHRKEMDKQGKYVVLFTRHPDGSSNPTVMPTTLRNEETRWVPVR